MAANNTAKSTQEVANRFSELAKDGKWFDIQNELFSDNAESIEPPHAQGLQTATGKDAIQKKGEQFATQIEEQHGGYCSEPVVGGNFFSVGMGMDVTLKGMGRMQMDEVAVYEVKDGQIVKEQFFY